MGPYEYVVESINGDYASLRRTDAPGGDEPMVVAMALLPQGIGLGSRLRWENFEYTVLSW